MSEKALSEKCPDCGTQMFNWPGQMTKCAKCQHEWYMGTGLSPAAPTGQSEWQPIETAPKDGTVFLGYWKKNGSLGVRVVYAVRTDTGFYWNDYSTQEMLLLTHWMPLPSPPSTGEQK
jgi:hypothetical protein